MILSKDDISKKHLINFNFKETSLDPASYNLRVGIEYINEIGELKKVTNNDIIILKKYCASIISTYEHVNIPKGFCGRFDMKVGWATKGLFFQAGPQIKPGYNGILWGHIFNLSDNDVHLIAGLSELFAIEFITTNSENIEILNIFTLQEAKKMGKITNPAKSGLATALKKSKDLVSRRSFHTWAMIYLVLFSLLITAILGVFSYAGGLLCKTP